MRVFIGDKCEIFMKSYINQRTYDYLLVTLQKNHKYVPI